MTQATWTESLHYTKSLVRADSDSLIGGIAKAASSRFFRNDDYIGEDGYRHCAKCKGAKEMQVSFDGTDLPDAIVPIACPCLELKRQEDEALYEERQRRERSERIRDIGLRTEQLRESRFENDDCKNMSTSKALRAFVSAWDDLKGDNCGLLLQGQVGTGKSFYAAAIANELIDQGEWVYFVTAPEIVAIAGDYSEFGRDRAYELERKVKDWDLLIVDDLGAQRNTEFGSEAVYNVINARYESGKPMIVTTNLTSEELENSQSLEERRIVDRVNEMCALRLAVVGKSRRRDIKEKRFEKASKILSEAMKELEDE